MAELELVGLHEDGEHLVLVGRTVRDSGCASTNRCALPCAATVRSSSSCAPRAPAR